LIDEFKMEQCMIFCRTQVDCDNLEQFLIHCGGGMKFRGQVEKGLESPYSCVAAPDCCSSMRRVPSPLPFGLQSEKAQKKQQFSGQFKTYVLFTLLVLIFWFLTTKILSLPLSCPETNKIHLKPKSIEDAISNRQQTQGWPDSQRVAWIVPYLSAPYLPKYAAFCFRTIATASPFLHFFLFYENASMILPDRESPFYPCKTRNHHPTFAPGIEKGFWR